MDNTEKNPLERKFLGKTFKNPILPASGCFGFGREMNELFPISEFGGLITKALTKMPRSGNAAPRIAETYGGMLNCIGLQNPGVDAFVEKELDFMLSHGIPLIANVSGYCEEDYLYVVEKLTETKVDMIELNISCPNVKSGGMSFGVDPVAAEDIVRKVKKIWTKPLIVKLSPNVTSIAEIAKAAERGGADAISLINTVTGLAVDLDTRKPILSYVTGGLSGPAVKPIALKMVRDCYKAVKIPIIGLGGISSYKDVIEFMLCGATMVEVGTLLMTDPLAVRKIFTDLSDWCEKNKISNLDEIVGGLIGL